MTWNELVKAEPRLVGLQRFVRGLAAKQKLDDSPSYCANYNWYVLVKPRLLKLVGWEAEGRFGHRVLGSEEAYDFVYDRLYDLLPDCNDCECWRV